MGDPTKSGTVAPSLLILEWLARTESNDPRVIAQVYDEVQAAGLQDQWRVALVAEEEHSWRAWAGLVADALIREVSGGSRNDQ